MRKWLSLSSECLGFVLHVCLNVCVCACWDLIPLNTARLNGAVQRADERVMNEQFEEIPMFETKIYRRPTYRQRHTLKCTCTGCTLWVAYYLFVNVLNGQCSVYCGSFEQFLNLWKIQLTFYSIQPIHTITHKTRHRSWPAIPSVNHNHDFLLTIIWLDCQQLQTDLNHRRKLSIS